MICVKNNTDGLRLMVYDSADVGRTLKSLRRSIPQDHIINLTIDEIDELLPGDFQKIDLDIPLGLTHKWIVGGHLYKMLRWVDIVEGFDTWEDALHWIVAIEPEKKIKQIQFWGHGSPGKQFMVKGHKALKSSDFQSNSHLYPLLEQVRDRLGEDSTIWFRSCSVFAGDKGQEFAKTISNFMGCEVAAHTYTIHWWQSGLRTIKPGQKPYWDPMEGIESGSSKYPKSFKWSGRNEPNTVFMINSGIPDDFRK